MAENFVDTLVVKAVSYPIQDSSAQEKIDSLTEDFNNYKANTYTKSEVDAVAEASGKVKTVNGEEPDSNGNINIDSYTKSETDSAISSGIAKIVANAPTDFDTLKEMSDWISTHEDSAAAMNTAIQSKVSSVKVGTNTYTPTNGVVSLPAYPAAYTHPTYTARSLGLYKISVENKGHVSSVTSVTSSDLANMLDSYFMKGSMSFDGSKGVLNIKK